MRDDTDLATHAHAFLSFANELLPGLDANDRDLAAELRRSSRAIGKNIERAAAIGDRIDKARTLGAARGRAMRCGALLNIARNTGSIAEDTCRTGIVVLERLVPALTRVIGGLAGPASGDMGSECNTMLRWMRDPR